MNKIIVFPGQGSQHIGMGHDIFQNFTCAKRIFQEVDDSLGQKLSDIIFFGPDANLASTENTQPAIMAVSMALMQIIYEETGLEIQNLTDYVAGHSLGEYSALCAAGAFSIKDTAKLLKTRGKAMQNACPPEEGAMAAIIGAEEEKLQQILNQAREIGVCDLANDNSQSQKVISGSAKAIEHAISLFKSSGIKAVKLNVSAAFHSKLIQAAEKPMQDALNQTIINKPQIPVISNVTANFTNDIPLIKENLIQQITGKVRWRETMELCIKEDITEIIEVGPGKVLSNLAKRYSDNFKCTNINDLKTLADFLNSF